MAVAAGTAIDAAARHDGSSGARSVMRPTDSATGPLAGASAEVVQPAAFAAVAAHYRASTTLHARLLRWIWSAQPQGMHHARDTLVATIDSVARHYRAFPPHDCLLP